LETRRWSLVGIRKLILLGAKTLVSSQKAAKVELREIREDIRELTAAQKRTDQKFERLGSSCSAAAAPTAVTKSNRADQESRAFGRFF